MTEEEQAKNNEIMNDRVSALMNRLTAGMELFCDDEAEALLIVWDKVDGNGVLALATQRVAEPDIVAYLLRGLVMQGVLSEEKVETVVGWVNGLYRLAQITGFRRP